MSDLTLEDIDKLVRVHTEAISAITSTILVSEETVGLAVDALCRSHRVLGDAMKLLLRRIERIERRLGSRPPDDDEPNSALGYESQVA